MIDEPKHKFMVPFLKLMPAAKNDTSINNFLDEYQVRIDIPLVPFNWKLFISQEIFFSVNFMPFLMFACGGISAFHYEQIVNRVDKNTEIKFIAQFLDYFINIYTILFVQVYSDRRFVVYIGCCPVVTAIGETASSKSTSLQVIGNMLGWHVVSQSLGEHVCSDQ